MDRFVSNFHCWSTKVHLQSEALCDDLFVTAKMDQALKFRVHQMVLNTRQKVN